MPRPRLAPLSAVLAVALPCLALLTPARADPTLECPPDLGSQVEIGTCVSAMAEGVDRAVATTYGFAMAAAKELDEVTGRSVASPALEAAQAAWAAYRDAQCEYVGATFGGGSGTGIGIDACRIELGRARVKELFAHIN